MKHRNLTDDLARILLTVALAVLLQACGGEVGGKEDDIQPVAALTSLNDGEEVIGTWQITWNTSEVNRSTVDLYISNDSGATWTLMKAALPDTGNFTWDSNEVEDCRSCRMRVVPRDVVGNVGAAADSVQDFIVNNVPQVLGIAYYLDVGNDGPGDLDQMRVPFDKDLELRTSIASDIFAFPVLGDSVGSFAEISRSPTNPRELLITMNDLSSFDFHLHVRGLFDPAKLGRTAPSGINLLRNISEGVIFAPDTGRTADAAASGIDIVPTFNDSGQVLGNSSASSATLGDIDGDGDLDLVIGNLTAPNQVLLNNGQGLFTDSGQALGPSNRFTTSMAIGDLDGDGDLDLVEGNRQGGTFANNQVWFNGGDSTGSNTGVFTALQALTESNTLSIALGDVDGDGDLDLVTGNSVPFGSPEPNRVWLNGGDNSGSNTGFFSDSGQALGNNNTSSIALGDVDGDGDLDLLEGNSRNFNVPGSIPQPNRVWFNGGDSSGSNTGVFTDSGQALGNSNTSSVAMGDVDGDGDLDIVVGNSIGEPNRVWLNNIDNTLGQAGVFSDSGQALGGLNTQAVALSDVDNDGDLDLVAGNGFGGTREVDTVWLNGGDSTGSNTGVFIDTGESLGSSDSRSIALGDVDGDGDLDLVTANSLFLNPLASTDLFIESIQLSDINRKTFSVSLGDVDGDGDLDLVAGNGATGIIGVTSPNRIWFNGGDSTGSNTGVFNNSGQVLGDSDTTSVALGDLDGDSDLDLVAGNGGTFGESEPNRVWLNSGLNTGIFIDSGQSLGNVPGFPLLGDPTTSVVLGDIDGDADLDLIAGNGGDFVSPNRVWRNDGDANFSEDPVPQELGRNSTTSIALGDLDGDGDLDLVAGNGGTLGGSEPNRVWLNSGLNTGIFIDSTQSLGSDITTSIALGDIDGDGDLDLVAGNNRQSNRVWRNDGNAYFSEDSPPQLLGTNATTSVSLVDVDDDGDLDLIEGIGTRSFGDAPASNRLWLNGGDSSGSNTGVFIDSGLDLGNDTTTSIAVGDIDGDDDPDYIEASADSGDFKSTVWLNDF